MIEQPIDILADIADSSLVLSTFNKISRGRAVDISSNRNDGTVTSKPSPLSRGGFIYDGVDDKHDFGDIGNIRTIEFWVNPTTTTQELLLVDAGKDIMVSAGTITYTGLTADATYVNGTAGTTIAASEWSLVMCVLNQLEDANNFETANDGANYGAISMKMLNVYNQVKGASFASFRYKMSIPEG